MFMIPKRDNMQQPMGGFGSPGSPFVGIPNQRPSPFAPEQTGEQMAPRMPDPTMGKPLPLNGDEGWLQDLISRWGGGQPKPLMQTKKPSPMAGQRASAGMYYNDKGIAVPTKGGMKPMIPRRRK